MKRPSLRIRLLPLLMGMCGVLFSIKAVGISEYAYAQAQSTGMQAQAPAAEPPKPKHDIASEAESSSPSEIDLLTNLARRRSELDARANELSMRENLIAAAEKRVDEKIAALKQLQNEIQKLIAARDAEQEKQVAALVKTYSAMKPADAARIFDGLNDEILVPVASLMKPDALAPVLAKMNPQAAQKLTVKLASRLNLPETKPVTVASAGEPVSAQAIAQPSVNLPVTSAPVPEPQTPAQGKQGG